MSFLLLPADEIELVSYLCDDLNLALLLSDVTDGGAPRVASEPLLSVPGQLPWRPFPAGAREAPLTASRPRTLLFWCPALGPVRTLADAPPPMAAADRVAVRLTQEAAGERYPNVMDLTRTPVIRWHRTCFQNERRLIPGLLQAMAVKVREQPPELLKLYRRIERWLKQRGEKLNPFAHCSGAPIAEPRNLSPFWVWVHPQAMEWVRAGGEIWPWTA